MIQIANDAKYTILKFRKHSFLKLGRGDSFFRKHSQQLCYPVTDSKHPSISGNSFLQNKSWDTETKSAQHMSREEAEE